MIELSLSLSLLSLFSVVKLEAKIAIFSEDKKRVKENDNSYILNEEDE